MVKCLLFNPSEYASDYAQGKRKIYIKPLNLFLIINLVYFVFSSYNTFKTNLDIQMNGLPYSGLVTDLIENKIEATALNLDEYREVYDQKTNEISKLIIIVLAPMFGVMLYLLFRRQQMFLSDGFNLGLQFWSFFILTFLLLMPLIMILIVPFVRGINLNTEGTTSGLILAGSMLYCYFMLKPWKGKQKLYYAFKILVIGVGFYPLVTLYRGILFILTFRLT